MHFLTNFPPWYEVGEQEVSRGSNYVIVQARDLRLMNTCPEKATVALKCIPRGLAVSKTMEEELLVHRYLWHGQIAVMREVFLTSTHLCIAVDYSLNGTVADLVKKRENGRLPEWLARWIFQQLIMVVDYCHRMEIMNLDIELKNILVEEDLSAIEATDRPCVKLCDFGACREQKTLPDVPFGTDLYVAPENYVDSFLLDGQNGKPADVWSCGVCLFYMLYGAFFVIENHDYLWESGFPHNLDMEIIIPEHIKEKDIELSEQCQEFLSRVLQVNPANRITVDAIWSHEWFKTDLPGGCQEYNAYIATDRELLKENIKGMQSNEELRSIFHLARRLGA